METFCHVYTLQPKIRVRRYKLDYNLVENKDGTTHPHSVNTFVYRQYFLHFRRNIFEFSRYHQSLEVSAASKETVLLHDNGSVVCRFNCSYIDSFVSANVFRPLVD